MGASYLAIHAITAIVPNESLIPTLTFYILNILPILASDILLSFSTNRRLSVFVSGSILGSSFLMIQYPLITYVYNEVFTNLVRYTRIYLRLSIWLYFSLPRPIHA
jgi:hypothetical protein